MFGFKKKEGKEKKKKVNKHDAKLLEQYEQGKILQVDNKIDNKDYLKDPNKYRKNKQETKNNDNGKSNNKEEK